MKVRESGMPDENLWESLMDVPLILEEMKIYGRVRDLVEFGCGYGTFSIPAARHISGKLYAIDIDPEMTKTTALKAVKGNLGNIVCLLRNFVAEGSGLADSSADYAMLFNILHAENPCALLCEAFRVLRPSGHAGIIHWNHDPDTPRGPPMEMRPTPEDCAGWIVSAGFQIARKHVNLPPYHYGILAVK